MSTRFSCAIHLGVCNEGCFIATSIDEVGVLVDPRKCVAEREYHEGHSGPSAQTCHVFFAAEFGEHVHKPEEMMVPFTSSDVLSGTLLISAVTTKNLSRNGKHTFAVRSRYAHSLLWLPPAPLIAQVEKVWKAPRNVPCYQVRRWGLGR